MKIFYFLFIICLLIIIGSKVFSKTEKVKNYELIDKYNSIEIRKYNKLIYASYTPVSKEDRSNSFQTVANFIFGNNNSNEKISMTSPVVIKTHNNYEMGFIMPEGYSMKNIPEPNNEKIKIYEEPSSTKAIISYSGYTNKKIEDKKIRELKEELEKQKIKYEKDFEILVYNSPYKIFNRKNEISVTVKINDKEMNNKIYLGGGCFWCVEAVFENVIGIKNVRSGFSGGKIKNPSYKEVVRGLTNHAEVCEIIYDNRIISLENILEIFFLTHDPTTLNRQGNDIGKHYRSIVFYSNEKENQIISDYIDKINIELFENKIVTEIAKFDAFYEAEGYHQNYYSLNSTAPYCKSVILPKLNKARKKLNRFYNK